jgi:hypothetical protein
MNKEGYSYFVIAATVASELNSAMLVAKGLSLTASNARVLALRAGQSTTGFSAITEFIDNLATVTISASNAINGQAMAISRIATDSFRADYALQRFDAIYQNSADARFLSSLDKSYASTRKHRDSLQLLFDKKVSQLMLRLEELAKELRTATVLSVMSRIEASQSGTEFEASLNNVAQNVSDAAMEIQQHVSDAQQLIHQMT